MAENEYPVDDDGYEWTEWEGRDYWRAAGSEDEWNLWGGEETNEIPDASPDKFATDSNYENEPFYDEEEDEDYEFSDSNGFGYRRVVSVIVAISLLAVGSWAFFIEDSAMNSAQKTVPDSPLTDDWMVYSVASESDLPVCDSSTNGRLYYVESDANFQVCKTTGWEQINLSATSSNSNYNPQAVLTTSNTVNDSACDIDLTILSYGRDNGNGAGIASNGILEGDEIESTYEYCTFSSPTYMGSVIASIQYNFYPTWSVVMGDKIISMESNGELLAFNTSTGESENIYLFRYYKDGNSGTQTIDSPERNLIQTQNGFYFQMNVEDLFDTIWFSDGTKNGTLQVWNSSHNDRCEWYHSCSVAPSNFHVIGNDLFFVATQPNGTEVSFPNNNTVWKFDSLSGSSSPIGVPSGIGGFHGDYWYYLNGSNTNTELYAHDLTMPNSSNNPTLLSSSLGSEFSLAEAECGTGNGPQHHWDYGGCKLEITICSEDIILIDYYSMDVDPLVYQISQGILSPFPQNAYVSEYAHLRGVCHNGYWVHSNSTGVISTNILTNQATTLVSYGTEEINPHSVIFTEYGSILHFRFSMETGGAQQLRYYVTDGTSADTNMFRNQSGLSLLARDGGNFIGMTDKLVKIDFQTGEVNTVSDYLIRDPSALVQINGTIYAYYNFQNNATPVIQGWYNLLGGNTTIVNFH